MYYPQSREARSLVEQVKNRAQRLMPVARRIHADYRIARSEQ